jgi:hypothetical protein
VLVEAIDTAATAVELILSIGVNEAMQRIHSQHKP